MTEYQTTKSQTLADIAVAVCAAVSIMVGWGQEGWGQEGDDCGGCDPPTKQLLPPDVG